MLTFRTKLLLALTACVGLGIGILSGLHDGAYSAACLFVLPILVTLTGGSILGDFSQEEPRQAEAVQQERNEQEVNWSRAA